MFFVYNYDCVIVNLKLVRIIDFSAEIQKKALRLFLPAYIMKKKLL